MPSIADIKAQYPELANSDDEQVVDVMQKAFYPDMPREQIADRLGVKLAPPPTEPSSKLRRYVADPALSLLQGAIQVPQAAVGLADLATGGHVGKTLENADGVVGFRPDDATQYLESLKSSDQQQANKNVAAASEGEGSLLDKTGRVIKAVAQNPSVIPHSIIQSLPVMGMGGVIGRGTLALAPKLGAYAGGIGEGVATMGSQAEQIRTDQRNPDRLLTPGQAALAAGSGALTGVIGAFSGRLAQKLGFENAENLLAGVHADPVAKAGIVRQTLGAAVTEGFLEELPQSVQEQVAQNMATGAPLDEGVDQQAVLGVLSGAAMGAGAHVMFHGKHSDALAAPGEPPAPLKSAGDVIREDLQPGGGPLAKAVNAGVENAAAEADANQPPPGEQAPHVATPTTADMVGAMRALPADQQEDALRLHELANRENVAPAVRRNAQTRLDRMLGQVVPAEDPSAPPAEPTGPVVAPGAPGNPTDQALARTEQTLRDAEPQTAPAEGEGAAPADGAMTPEEAQAQRERDRPAAVTGQPIDGDILTASGVPFRSMFGAMRALAQAGGEKTHDLVRVADGLVVRPKPKEQTDGAVGSPAEPGSDARAAAAPAADAGGTGSVVPGGEGDRGTPGPLAGPDASAAPVEQPGGAAAAPAPALSAEWQAFTPESGTKGVPRANMPQIAAEHRGALVNFLEARGIGHDTVEIPAGTLKPTQAEFSPAKVAKAIGFEGGDRSILVSSDGHVLDGHHQWIAKHQTGQPIKAIRLDAPIDRLLAEVRDFPSATQADGATAAMPHEPIAEAGTSRPAEAASTAKEAPAASPEPAGNGEGAARPAAAGPAAVEPAGLDEHVTQKGKTLRGKWRLDITERQAKAIDSGTFQSNGKGWFIRERSLDKLAAFDREREAAPAAAPGSRVTNPDGSYYTVPPEPKHPNAITKARAKKAAEEAPASAPAPAPAAAPTPAAGANTIFTEDAAAAARALLKRKLGQLNSGIDPEILQAGITLAGYHIEKGARTFAAYAQAMVADMGEGIKPYLKSFYMAVKYDPRASSWTDMDKAGVVDEADVSTFGPAVESSAPNADTAKNGDSDGNAARQLDQPGRPALEGAPAEPLQGAAGERATAPRAETGGSVDVAGSPSTEGSGGRAPGGVGAGTGAAPVPAPGAGRKPRGPAKPRVSQSAGLFSDDGQSGSGRLGGVGPENDAPNAAPIAAPQFHPTDFKIADDFALGEGGEKTKFRANVEAIRLLKSLEQSGALATPEQQAILARYVGWGGLSQAFNAEHADWKKESAELKGLLTPSEWDDAMQSTQFAHYTSRPIINGIYDALSHMGFTGGKIAEAGSGVGNFIGLMPEALRSSSRFTGIEREPIAAGIARQLYPQQNIQRADFTEFKGNDDYYDVATGNPPFARTALTDNSGRKHLSGLSVHNYFFAKSVDMLRPGGILAQVVTNSFLDAKKDTARRYIADRTRFLGAIRLPNNAFAKNAGTQVTTDIVFLQKLPESEWASRTNAENRNSWLDVASVADSKGGADLPVNQYFADHPDMMLGDFGRHGTMYGPDQAALIARPSQDTAALLAAAIKRLPGNVYVAPAVLGTARLNEQTVHALADSTVQEGGHYVADGKVYRRIADEAGEGRAVEITPQTMWTEKTTLGDAGFERVRGLSSLRSTLRSLLGAEIKGDAQMTSLRAALNTEYDAYVKAHGFINDKASARVFEDDPDYPLLASLEHKYTPGIGPVAAKKQGIKHMKPTAVKGPIFSGRVVEQRAAPTRAATPADALNVSIAERGRIDADYIGKLLGRDGAEVLRELTTGDKPLLFVDPGTDEHVLRDAYLSGNVRDKLAQAKAAAMFDNVKALEAVQPEDVGAHEINARLGAPWVPTSIYQDFAQHLFGDGTKANLGFIALNGSFTGTITAGSQVAATNTWGTQDVPGPQILLSILNNREVKVTYRDAEGKTHTDIKATELANQKATDVRSAFQDWIFKDGDRAEALTRAYNDTNNNYVTRDFDGGYLNFPGKVPDSIIKFRRHQRNAIARIVQDRTALLDHVVGAGKTFTVISAAMELKRTGLANKNMVIVPNHLVKQWAADFYRLYPGANVLTATKKDFEKTNRRRFLAKIATGDWDAVVMAHSSFGFVKPAPDFEQEFNEKQIANVMATIQSVEDGDGDKEVKKRTVKQLAALKDRLTERIKALRDKPIDGLLDLNETGIDQLFVDEAHLFKNLMFTTKMQNVLGLGDPAGSQRAYDLYVKASQIYAKNGRGQGVVFATGTPVSNSLAEMYHMMRYLMPQVMDQQFPSFDAWANTFAAVEPVWMQKTSGDGYKASNRMSTFVNTPELLKLFDQVSDTVTMEDIKSAYREENDGAEFPLPKIKTGRRQPVSIEKTPAQTAYMEDLARRAAAIEGKRSEKGGDNPLKIMGDGRKAAMDIRLVDLSATEREKGGRIDRAAEEIKKRYDQYHAVKGTQLVFSDLGTPIKHAQAEMKEFEALRARIDKAASDEVQTRANFGDEAALATLEDGDAAQAEIDGKGADWLGAVQAALRGFSVYDDLKKALVERGIPENEVAFIHDYNTDDRKADLFRKVNSGDMRVLIGSTAKLGAGTNVQERLVAEHHLDVPWKPSDVEQREGRIIRQGNVLEKQLKDFEAEILAYVTKDTLDMRMWQVQETKLKMINQLRTRQIGREVDNAFEDMELSAGEMQAAATGNMDLLKEIQLRTDVKKLEQSSRSHDAQRSDLESRRKRAARELSELPPQIARATSEEAIAKQYSDAVEAHRQAFKATIDGKEFTDSNAAAGYLRDKVDAVVTDEKGKEKAAPLDVTMNGTQYTSRAALGEAFADLRGDVAGAPLWNFGGTTYVRETQAAKAIVNAVVDSVAEQKVESVGSIGPFAVTVEGQPPDRMGRVALEVVIRSGGVERSTTLPVISASENDSRQLAQNVTRAARGLVSGIRQQSSYLQTSLQRAQKTSDELAKTPAMGDFPQQAKLEAARAAHKEVLARLNAKPEVPAAAEDDQPAASRDRIAAAAGVPAQQPPGARASQIRELVGKITANWANAPAVVVLQGMDDPQTPARLREADAGQRSQGAEGSAEGFFDKGTVYLMADQLRGDADVVRVLMHESLGHYGLRGVFGKELGTILDRLTMLQGGKVRDKARQYGLDFEKQADRRAAAEEVLADMAQTSPHLGWVQRAVAAVRTWLRENVPGYRGMKLSDDEIIRNFIEPARNFVRKGQGAVPSRAAPVAIPAAASRDQAPAAFSRSIAGVLNDAADIPLPAGRIVGDLFNKSGTINWWHKTIGTQFNLAERYPEYKRVYVAVQNFINDTSRYANEQADLAPRMLPKLDSWKNILPVALGGKAPVSAPDTKAIARPIFEGTLSWTRDAAGKPVQVEDIKRAAADLTAEQKARELFRAGHVSEQVLKMWQGLPIDQFEKLIESKHERDMQRAGIVWTDDELRARFGATPGQIELYHEFRNATDRSLSDLATSEMVRLAGKDIDEATRTQMMRLQDHDKAGIALRDHLWKLAEADPARADVLNGAADKIVLLADKTTQLQKEGYAPLSRFGQYSLDVVNPDGTRAYFGLFESSAERSKMARQMAANFPDAKITQGTVSQEAYKLFAGVSPETIELFGNLLGLDSTGDEGRDQAFQQAIKLTASTRSSMRRLIHRKGIAGFSEDAGRVLAGFVVSNSRRTSSNLHMGEVDQATTQIPKEMGELTDAAVKLGQYVKNPQEEAQGLRGLLFAQYLGGSIASAMVNATQPFTVTMPWLSQWGGAAAAGKQMAAAVRDQGRPTTGDAKLDAALKDAAERGIVAPQEIHQLMGQAAGKGKLVAGDGTRAGDALAMGRNAWAKGVLAWGKVFSIAEQFNRRSTFIAAYRTAVAQGMPDPAAFAERAVTETQFVYNKGNKPAWARGAIGGTLFTFKSYSVSYLELMGRMWDAGEPGSEERASGRRAVLFAVAMLFLIGGADGLPFEDDASDALDGFMQHLGYNFSTKRAKREFFASVLGEDGGRFVQKGLSGLPGMPIDVSGRMGMANLVPGTGLFTKKANYGSDVAELFGPVGDLAKRAGTSLGQALDGDITGAMTTMQSTAVRNIAKGVDMLKTDEYRDSKGRKVIDTNAVEAVFKMLGFQPGSVARVQEASGEVMQTVALTKLVQAEVGAKMAKAIYDKDPDEVASVRELVARWNDKNDDSKIKINMAGVLKQVRDMHASKADRIAKTAPASMRQQVRAELSDASK